MKNYFGTDGIRAKVGEKNMTPEFALKLGYAAGCAFKEMFTREGRPKVLIGKDTRISGYLIESALEAGFSAAGVDVALLGPIPTPAIAYLTRTFQGCAGVVVSASHNPYYDNGIKFFSDRGKKLNSELEQKINQNLSDYIDSSIDLVKPMYLGKASRIDDARGRYVEHCKSTVSPRLNLDDLSIVLDCANGATYQVAPAVFKELGAKVHVIHAEPNGQNINAGCGSTDTSSLRSEVLSTGADLGIAFDGDGDRVILVDNQGTEVDGDAILYLIVKGLISKGITPNGVVGTVMTNMGAFESFKKIGVGFKAAAVGDKHVMEEMVKSQWNVGGESSGHIICLDKSTTGDGIVAALQVLETLVETKQSMSELLKDYAIYPMKMINIAVRDKGLIMENQQLQAEIAKAESMLKNQGRLLIRASGTEPKVRVMVEAKRVEIIEEYINKFETLIRNIGE